MNPHHVYTIALYEYKKMGRSWLFRFFMLVTILMVSVLVASLQYSSFGLSRSGIDFMPHRIPHFYSHFYNLFQAFMVIFVVVESSREETRADSIETFKIRPTGNAAFDAGRMTGWITLFTVMYLVCTFPVIFFHLFFSNAPFNIGHYAFYFLFWTLPTLLFMLGLSLLLTRVFRHTGLTALALLGFLWFSGSYLSTWLHGTLDFRAEQITDGFSDILGYQNTARYLAQRAAVLLTATCFVILATASASRIPNRHDIRLPAGVTVITLCILAILLYRYYYSPVPGNREKREEYRKTLARYTRDERPRVKRNDIIFQQDGKNIRVTGKMLIENPNTKYLDTLILYLNPSLKVNTLTSREKNIPFRRDNQVIIAGISIAPGQQIQIEIEYGGTIDERACYIDIPEDQLNESFLVKRYAITGEELHTTHSRKRVVSRLHSNRAREKQVRPASRFHPILANRR